MKKAIKWTLIVIGILLVILITVPFLFKDKIVAKIKSSANENLNAKFDFKDVSLSLIRHFPNLSIGISDLSIINVAPFDGDTLIYAKDLSATVDIMSVISGDQIKIRKVFVDNAVMNFLVDANGKANWNITKPSPPSTTTGKESSFKANLKHYELKNGRIVYEDKTMGMRIALADVNHEGSGDFTQDLFDLHTHTESGKNTLVYGGVAYLNEVKATIDADLQMDMKNSRYTFKDNKIHLNDLDLGFSGWIAMPDTNIDMDLKFSAAQSDFKNFISLVPAVYSKDFKDAKSSGKMAFNGWAKGRYNAKQIPGFGIKLDIDNGSLKYPSLPSDLKNVFVNLDISNPDGVTDHTVVNLSRMHLEMAGDPFDARLMLRTPISDPDFDFSAKGKVDFGSIQKIVPLEKGTTLSGVLTADVSAKGRYSYVKQNQYDRFQAAGNFNITGMNYTSASLKKPVQINRLAMSLTPKVVSLTAFDMKTGNTDLQAEGSLENFIPYALKKNETLKGNLKMHSTKVDLNEWMSSDTQAASKGDTTSMTAMEVPGDLDFTINAVIGTLLYENVTMTNCAGEIVIRNKAINLNNLKANLLDGSMVMNGMYATPDIKHPDIAFDFALTDFNVQKTASTFNTIDKMAPIAKSCSGKFSCNMSIKGKLDNKLNPVYNTLNGSGKLNTSQITVSHYAPAEKAADVLKMPSLKQLNIPQTNLSFKFTNGRVYVDPFDVTLNGFKTTIGGSNGFDQTIDYTANMNIPRSSFGGAANSVLNSLTAKAGTSLDDQIPVALKITGTTTNPKISADLNQAGAKVMNDLKAAASAEFEKKKSEAEAKLKAEADKAKADAEAKIKAEADKRTQAAKDSLKKAADQKAKEQLNKFNPFKKK